MGRIYRIDNLENLNFYIGQTRNSLSRRLNDHRSEARRGEVNMILYNAMRKYGPEMFTIEDVEVFECETRQELVSIMNAREKFYIETLRPPYNTAPGGLGHTGVTWTEARRLKFKELMSGPNNPNYGKPMDDDTKQKLSEALKGRIIPQEVRDKTSRTMKGVPKTAEMRRKLAEANKGRAMPRGAASKKSIPVSQFDKSGIFIKTHGSLAEAAETASCQRSGITMCCKGKLSTSGGFIWKYAIQTSSLGGEELSTDG